MRASLRLLTIMTALSLLSGCIDPVKAPYVNVHDLVTRIDESQALAEQGSPDDHYRLGVKYESLVRDYRTAVHWYRMAARERHADALYRLCILSDRGRGLPQDYQEALRWCRLAVDQAHAQAMFTIGTFFENGRGVPKDLVHAHQWYNLAATHGLVEGATRRDRLAFSMTSKQIAQAQVQARDWKASAHDTQE